MPTALYGAESWSGKMAERKRLNVMEIKCLRSICTVALTNSQNEEVRKRTGGERDGRTGRVTCAEMV